MQSHIYSHKISKRFAVRSENFCWVEISLCNELELDTAYTRNFYKKLNSQVDKILRNYTWGQISTKKVSTLEIRNTILLHFHLVSVSYYSQGTAALSKRWKWISIKGENIIGMFLPSQRKRSSYRGHNITTIIVRYQKGSSFGYGINKRIFLGLYFFYKNYQDYYQQAAPLTTKLLYRSLQCKYSESIWQIGPMEGICQVPRHLL